MERGAPDGPGPCTTPDAQPALSFQKHLGPVCLLPAPAPPLPRPWRTPGRGAVPEQSPRPWAPTLPACEPLIAPCRLRPHIYPGQGFIDPSVRGSPGTPRTGPDAQLVLSENLRGADALRALELQKGTSLSWSEHAVWWGNQPSTLRLQPAVLKALAAWGSGGSDPGPVGGGFLEGPRAQLLAPKKPGWWPTPGWFRLLVICGPLSRAAGLPASPARASGQGVSRHPPRLAS